MAAASARAANEEVVRRIFGAFAQKQGFALRDLFAPDAVWIVPGDGTMAGVHRGREAIFRFLARLPKETGGSYSSQLVDVLASSAHTRATLLVTHDDELVTALADRGVALGDEGARLAA